MKKLFLLLIFICTITATKLQGATGCNYPASLDSYSDLSTGDFLTATAVNSRSCAIEKLEARLNQVFNGIAGGQTIKGGTGAADGLFLTATSGNDVGAASIWFMGGNNGATTWAKFNAGKLLMGAATNTGSAAGDIVIPVTKRYAFATADGTTSANSAISIDSSNNWLFDRPATGNAVSWRWNGTSLMQFQTLSGGAQIYFLSESGGDPVPSANGAVLYTKDNGSGKTQLCVKFFNGSANCFATEP